MAQWRPPRYKVEYLPTGLGGGMNANNSPFSVGENELLYAGEMDSWKYPALAVRPYRGYKGNVGTPYAVGGAFDDNLLMSGPDTGTTTVGAIRQYSFDLNTQYNNSTSVSLSYGNFAQLVTGANTYAVYMNSTGDKKYFTNGTTALNISDTNCPVTNIVTTFKSRVYAARNKTLYYSALNSVTNWTTANDAGNIVIANAVGNITALIPFDDKLIIFAQGSVHALYGSGPLYYQVVDISRQIGCIGPRAVSEVNGKLYWIDQQTLYEFNGATIRDISANARYWLDNQWSLESTDNMAEQIGVSGVDRYVYFALNTSRLTTTPDLILKYDSALGQWFKEGGYWSGLVNINKKLLGVDKTGSVYNMRNTTGTAEYTSTGSNTTTLAWAVATKPYTDGSAGQMKTLSELTLTVNITTNCTSFQVGYSSSVGDRPYDTPTITTSFRELFSTHGGGSTNTQIKQIKIPVNKLQNMGFYRLIFLGTGDATIHSLERSFRVRK